MERADLIRLFLKKNNLDKANFSWLPSDASFRHYARINDGKKSYIFMDAPPPEIPEQFALVAQILCENGLSAPEIYSTDFENGFILLEDFGNKDYSSMLSAGFNEKELYKTAVDALIQVSKIKKMDGIPLYDRNWLFEGLSVFCDWFIPHATGEKLSSKELKSFEKIWDNLFNSIQDAPFGLVLNDFHMNNMMYLERKEHQICGLLDFQDARIGPLAYDMVSFIEDARRSELPEDLKEYLFARYLENNPTYPKDLFMKSYHIMAVKRHLRVIGVFVRLKARDGKGKYLKHINHVWKLLENHLDLPYMNDFKTWLDINVPKAYRKCPDGLEE
ncbi:MAG: aminoglycoside phosphotransferase [Alphaproteobacteria bacterium]|nr:aminoglycoside phosphotransferase [Alphaproteobacteria bacterium]